MNELDFQGADMVGLSSKRIGDILIQATTSESYDDTRSPSPATRSSPALMATR